MISLRSENKVLKNYIKDVKSQEFSLLTSKRDSFNDSFITETEQEEQISNKKFDTFLKSISSVNNNVMNYCYSYSKYSSFNVGIVIAYLKVFFFKIFYSTMRMKHCYVKLMSQ